MSKFYDVSKAIQDASNGYAEIDPKMQHLFLETFNTFLMISEELNKGTYEDISSPQVKVSVFENVFDINVTEEVLIITEKALMDRQDGSDDANEVNADKDLLASIRENFDNYLKD